MAYTIRQTAEFADWAESIRDREARARVAARIKRAAGGNLGDVKPTSETGISEMRIDCGPGYRLYFTRRGRTVIFLLCGGTKKGQNEDIRRASRMAKELED